MTWLKRVTLSSLIVLSLTGILLSQPKISMGPEFQIYPTGAIPGVQMLIHTSEVANISLRLGYNVVYHGDAGEHDDERGGGFGFTLGYQRSLSGGGAGLFAAIRSDVWFNELDWLDYDGTHVQVLAEGTSKVTVVQPTVKAGYRFDVGIQDIQLIPTLAFGFEINVRTRGAEVGQGAILLAGIAMAIPLGSD